MIKLSTGENSTLGEYRKIAKIFGKAAIDFIDEKIATSPNGKDEEVIADESQMLILFAHLVK